VRRLASVLSVDIEALAFERNARRVTREDVLAAAAQRDAAAAPPVRQSPPARSLTGIRRTVADNLAKAWVTPQVSAWDDAPAARLLAAKRASGAPWDALLVEAVLPVLHEHPEFSARFDGETVVPSAAHDIGLALNSPHGLVVAVVRGAADLSPAGRLTEIRRLLVDGKAGRLAAADLRDQSFTISNIGAVGGHHGTAIVPVGTTAILSAGKVTDQVCAVDGGIAVVPKVPLGLSFDHRVIDGIAAAAFLASVRDSIASLDAEAAR
jgi:pyruvate dehydrogenase E2 component (dihydrolipoamide acetyltransferase)